MYRLRRASVQRRSPSASVLPRRSSRRPAKQLLFTFSPSEKKLSGSNSPFPLADDSPCWPLLIGSICENWATCNTLLMGLALPLSNEGLQLVPVLSPTVSSCLFVFLALFFLSKNYGSATDVGDSDCRLRPLGWPFFFS